MKVLLINLSPDEVRLVGDVLSQFDMEVEVASVANPGDAEAYIESESVVLTVFRLNGLQTRPDQDVRRIRRKLSSSAPILVLIPAEQAGKVRDYLRAGADEYWILPLDQPAFPPRLYVLLEWGQSVLTEAVVQQEKDGGGARHEGSLLYRAWTRLRQLLFSRPSGSSIAVGLELEIAGKWRKIRRLGFGSFGEAWLVEEKGKTGLAVAKIPHTPKMNTKFLREAAILKRLEGHRNAVQFKEVVKEERKVILIQEYVEGSTLQQLLDQEMDSVTKEKAFLELLEVVAFAHRKDIMHRDIKPENIIINTSGVLKLLDFGTGKDLTRRSISNTVIGSRPFMAPEQIMGKSRIASDVWAMGVILYALATGFLPFYDENEKQLMDMILEVAPEPPRNLDPGISGPLEALILKCLEKDWTKRYRNADELQSDLLARFPSFGTGSVLPG